MCLCPDHAWRLIAYPYYCKYAVPGDTTFFRNIAVDVGAFVKDGTGGAMIQGSVSLYDEDELNCIECS